MNKLLLLATSLISLGIGGNAADANESGNQTNPGDSNIKEVVVTDPKDHFKNLFDTEATAAGFNVKLNPLAVSFVQDYMVKHTGNLNKLKSSGRLYFDMMDGVLARHGLPKELKYLSVIESNLKSNALSWAGARGPWQFMPETARRMGLKVSRKVDERTDFTKSTHAAARYLTELYGIYDDWLLVIAAYNGGPGNVNSAIRRSGSRNFWDLQQYLPAESRNHVKKFIATHYIMEGVGGMTTLTRGETDQLDFDVVNTNKQGSEGLVNVTSLPLSGKYSSVVIARNLEMGIGDFNKLNPNFDKLLASSGSYEMKLPNDKATLFQAIKPQILEQSVKLMLTTGGR